MGSSPLLSVMWKDDGSVNVSCESEGWYPQPTLQWSNQDQTLHAKGLVHRTDTSGLVSVHSWTLISTPFRVTCSVGLSKQDQRQGFLFVSATGGSSTGWQVAFILTLVALLVSMAVLAVKHYKYNKRGKTLIWIEICNNGMMIL